MYGYDNKIPSIPKEPRFCEVMRFYERARSLFYDRKSSLFISKSWSKYREKDSFFGHSSGNTL